VSKKKLVSITCETCSGTFEYQGYGYKRRKFCDVCLPKRKHEIVLENARNPKRIEKTRLLGLSNKGKSINVGKKHGNWKGDNVGIDALHSWVIRRLGRPPKCEHCGSTDKKTEWANKSQQYKRDIEDWLRLCRSCHLNYDYGMGVRNGKK